MTTTSCTHCHFVMQARALRVPEVCVNHTSPPCLVAYPFTKMEYWVLNTLVLPDPYLTQECPVTFPACAFYQLFVRSCNLAHDGQHCSHFCANTHRSLFLHLALVFAFDYLCSQSIRMCGRLLALLSGIESLLLHGQLTLCTALFPAVP